MALSRVSWPTALLLALFAIAHATADEKIDYRLPTALEPTHYELYFHPELDTGNFTGQVKITINVKQATNQIILHSHKLTLSSVYVPDHEIDNYALEPLREFLIIEMKQQLKMGETFLLGIHFEGQMQNKLVGLYSSTYNTPAGQQRNISTTKFEPTYARQAFPCFDEPALKATFAISVIHPTAGSYDAVSNMNKLESQNLGENTMATFATSVPMSTYLACFIVSDFEHKKSTVKANGIGADFEMRAFATPHQINKVTYALEFGVAVTEYYIKYFKVEYPLPKLDMAAIPDFVSNAMEHWGLVTYRETALLYDTSFSSAANKQATAGVLAHEITHQWFGNLVTMKWWNDLWLNEGFARFMQYKGVDEVHPDWDMLDQFVIMALHPVLVFDAKLSSHPIVQKVENPDEITSIFDTISYDKAGSILRMLENLVGADKFEQAVTNYLTKYKYQNTVTDDFLSEVAALVTDFDLKLLMRTWTEQMGYPVLNVERTDKNAFTISQKRFLSNKASYEETVEPTEFGYKWSVPITYFLDTAKTNEASSFIFDYNKDMAGVAVEADVKWIKLNVQQMGYYRVNYDTITWEYINQQLIDKYDRFDIADRANLLNDAFALADASQLAYSIPLDMTAYLSKEEDFVPWYTAASNLIRLKRNLMYTESFTSYLNYARSLVSPVYKAVGWTVDEDDHLRNRLRYTVVNAACALGVEECLQEAAKRFNTWLANPTAANKPAPDLREIVYYYGMEQSKSEASFDQLLQLYSTEADASEKQKMMNGLAATKNAQLLYRLLDLASINDKTVRSQDYFNCVQLIASNPVGEPLVWDYYREHWTQLTARFGLNDRALGRLITSVTAHFASEVKLEEVQEFLKKHPESGAGASPRQQAIETIKYNINWLKENSGEIANWLSQKL